MQVIQHCPSNHVWTSHGPCPVCGSEAVTSNSPGGTLPISPDIKPTQFPRIDGYEFHKEIGSGGMGVVYKATQISLGREVALKLIRSRELANLQDQKRFVIEAEVVAKLQHPNIVQVYDVGVSEAGPYYTMELLSGTSLAVRLEGGQMNFREGAKLLVIIARAVDYAHQHGIVHRDLKPANIMMTENSSTNNGTPATGGPAHGSSHFLRSGTLKLVDFGIAKNLASDNGLTETGKPIGTPGYMAPEQAAGKKEIGPGADVYALGVILYKFVSGRVPFEGDNLYDVLHSIITVDPVSPAYYRNDVPRDLEAICMKCLRKSPAERYPTAAALADDLDRYLNHQKISVGWTPPWRSVAKWCRRHPTKTMSIATALLFIISAVLVVSVYERKREKVPVPEVAEDPSMKLRREEVERRVKVFLQAEPQPDKAQVHELKNVPNLEKPSYAAFAVLQDDRVVDLRAWKKVPPNDPSVVSYVIFNNRRVLSKIRAEDKYATRFQTTGRDLILRGISPDEDAVAFASKADVGGVTMKTGHVVMDVSGVPLNREFTAQTMATFIDNLQKPEDQWVALIGFHGSQRSSMLILFPSDRPFKEYSLRVVPEGKGEPQLYTGPEIVFKGEKNLWVYWEVSAPQDGYVYRIDWTW